MKDKETTIGHLLLESLTKDQIACMLEVVASAWDSVESNGEPSHRNLIRQKFEQK